MRAWGLVSYGRMERSHPALGGAAQGPEPLPTSQLLALSLPLGGVPGVGWVTLGDEQHPGPLS